MTTKICLRCLNALDLNRFGADRSKKDGLDAYCRACVAKGAKIKVAPPDERICKRCGENKPIAAYSLQPRRSDGRDMVCHGCRAKKQRESLQKSPHKIDRTEKVKEYNRKTRKKIKAELLMYAGGKCVDCGLEPSEEWPATCFDFHHSDPRQKEFNLSKYGCLVSKLPDMKKEVMQCVVLCSNCHRRRHARAEDEMAAQRYDGLTEPQRQLILALNGGWSLTSPPLARGGTARSTDGEVMTVSWTTVESLLKVGAIVLTEESDGERRFALVTQCPLVQRLLSNP